MYVHENLANSLLSSMQYLRRPLIENRLVIGGGREMAGILTLVRFPLLSQFSGRLDGALTAVLFQILVGHDFTANKFVLEVRTGQGQEGGLTTNRRNVLDDAGSLWCLSTFSDSPRSHFVRTTCEVPD